MITTMAQVVHDRNGINDHKTANPVDPPLLPLSGINIAFSQFGLTKVFIIISLPTQANNFLLAREEG